MTELKNVPVRIGRLKLPWNVDLEIAEVDGVSVLPVIDRHGVSPGDVSLPVSLLLLRDELFHLCRVEHVAAVQGELGVGRHVLSSERALARKGHLQRAAQVHVTVVQRVAWDSLCNPI